MYATAYKNTVTANAHFCAVVRKLLSEPRGPVNHSQNELQPKIWL